MDPQPQLIDGPRVASRGDREAAIERILASETFRRAAKQREFFRYVAAHTLSGDTDSITEQQIGIAVFGKDATYNPGDDSVVRVQARHLREKLAEYFASEGMADAVVVTIPKGRYVPAFEIRRKADPVAAPPMVAAPRPARAGRWWLVGLLCALAFAAGVAFRSLPLVSGQPAATATNVATPPMNPILAAVLQPGRETMVVMEDMGLWTAYAFHDRDEMFKLDDYRLNRFMPDVASRFRDEAAGRRLASRLSASRFVAYANASFVFKFAAAYPESSRNLTVRFPRDIHLRDVQANNLILLGGTVVNPWVGLYEDGLNFAVRYLLPGGGFANRVRAGSEPEIFGDSRSAPRLYYARIALVPNLQVGSRVLILTGLGTEATEAAADFVLNPRSAGSLPAEVVQALRQPGYAVEILLKCVPLLEAPYRSEVAAWRVRPQ